MVNTKHINITKTATNIQKTCIPSRKALLLGEGRTGRATIAFTVTDKSTSNFKAENLRNH